MTSASPIALLGSLLAHAAVGAAMLGVGTVSTGNHAPAAPLDLTFVESVETPRAVEAPAPEVVEPPPVVRRAAKPTAPPAAPPPSPAPAATEPVPPVTAAPSEPVAAAPAAPGVAADSTVGTDAKGFAAGSTAVGAKATGPVGPTAPGAVSLHGVVGGTGDRSRVAGLADGRTWDCPFPREADDEGIDSAQVTLQVEIGADNSVLKANVVRDPGFGFGQEARRCALRRRWLSQLNRDGLPVNGRATVVVNFTR